MQEQKELASKVERSSRDRATLEQKVLSLNEEFAARDRASYEERVQREAVIQDINVQRNSLQTELGALQAQLLSVSHDKQTVEQQLKQFRQVSSETAPVFLVCETFTRNMSCLLTADEITVQAISKPKSTPQSHSCNAPKHCLHSLSRLCIASICTKLLRVRYLASQDREIFFWCQATLYSWA